MLFCTNGENDVPLSYTNALYSLYFMLSTIIPHLLVQVLVTSRWADFLSLVIVVIPILLIFLLSLLALLLQCWG